MNAPSSVSRRTPASLSFVTPLLFSATMLAVGPALGACDGSAPGALLASDTENLEFTNAQSSTSASYRLYLSANAVPQVSSATLGVIVDVVAGGPSIEVSVTPPSGTAVTDSTPEPVTSSGVSYDRYALTLPESSALCEDTGACTLDYSVSITRAGTDDAAFTAIATVSGVIVGDAITTDDVALDFL